MFESIICSVPWVLPLALMAVCVIYELIRWKGDDMAEEKRLFDYLVNAGMTPAGAAGMMGNMYAESGLIPNRVEILCLKRLREHGRLYTDATYTAFVDDGTISRAEFMNPLPGKQYGYGLCQWTSPGRKAGLYDLCRSRKASIGDQDTQLECRS